jgi:hypothetical protein
MNKLSKIVLFLMLLEVGVVLAQSVTKVVDNGPDGEKLTFVVLGDGYALEDQTKFASDVDTLVVHGVFGHDFYKDSISAFNVYRVALISKESGVSTLKFKKNTALKVIFSGRWDRCWLEESQDTDELITQAANQVKKYDYVLVIANEDGYGGCRRGSRLYVTSGSPWNVVAHEYGHGIAGLYDEYSAQGGGAYSGERINVKNCSVVLNRNNVAWSQLMDQRIDLPSDGAQNVDSNQTVGEFTGCNYAKTAIYRPVRECRMMSITSLFCPVCLGLMNDAVRPYLRGKSSLANLRLPGEPGPPPSEETYINMVIRISKDQNVAVLKATEVKGTLIPSQQAAPAYIVAFTKQNEPSLADSLPEDPYVVRGFVDPEHKEKGENISLADSATIIVNVPRTSMTSAIHDLGLRLFSVKPGSLDMLTAPQLLDFKSAKTLMQTPGVEQKLDVPPVAFGAAVGAKAERLQ